MTITNRNYVLVDFENTQSVEPQLLAGLPVRVVLFVGANQKSLPVDLVRRLLEYPGVVEIVESPGVGKNALDFQIAFYAGRIIEREPQAYLHFVSRDKGFDPLVTAIKQAGRPCHRVESFKDLAFLHAPEAKSTQEKVDFTKMGRDEQVNFIIQRFQKIQAATRPRKVRTLRTSISAHFGKQLSTDVVDAIISSLMTKGHIVVGANDSINYKL